MAIVNTMPVYIPCIDCDWYENNTCDKLKQTPPDEILMVGCGEGVEQIPF